MHSLSRFLIDSGAFKRFNVKADPSIREFFSFSVIFMIGLFELYICTTQEAMSCTLVVPKLSIKEIKVKQIHHKPLIIKAK